jgi:hypothetical protein
MNSPKSANFPIFSFNYTSLTMPDEYCKSEGNTPRLHAKKGDEKTRELAIPLLFNQYDESVSETFYDPLSEELISNERNNTTNLEGILAESSDEREYDIDSFYTCMAQRLIAGDTDNHESQFAVDEAGRFYTFDFEYAGEPLEEIFANGISWTRSIIYQIGETQHLEGNRETEREIISDNLEQKGMEIANKVDVQEFERALTNHPHIQYDKDNQNFVESNLDLNQLISNLERMSSEKPVQHKNPDWYWEDHKEEIPNESSN